MYGNAKDIPPFYLLIGKDAHISRDILGGRDLEGRDVGNIDNWVLGHHQGLKVAAYAA